MEKVSVTLAFLLIFITIGASSPLVTKVCPTEEDLYPCTCKRMAFGLHVKCVNFNNITKLVKSFKVLRDYRVQNVLLHGLRMKEVLPSDIFDGLEISELRVEQSKLKFSEPAFSGLDESLNILNVAQHTMIKSSENFSLAKLNKLTKLNIKSNSIHIVRNQWLNEKIPNVRSIHLDEDEIDIIESRAFADLINLEKISISDNRIKSVERSMFPRPANALTEIDLNGNEIKSLPYDFFFDMPKLEKVVLSGNDISTLPERTWKSVWEQLHSLSLFENSLVCDENLDWIKNLRWPKQVVGTCVAPTDLIGKTLKDVYNT